MKNIVKTRKQKRFFVLVITLFMLFVGFVSTTESFASAGIVPVYESESLSGDFETAAFSFSYNDFVGSSASGDRICACRMAFTLPETSDVKVYCETYKNSFGPIDVAIGPISYFREYQIYQPDANGVYHLQKGDYYLFLYQKVSSPYYYYYGNAYVVAVRNHSYGDWVTTKPACESEGTKEKTCSTCGKKVTETIPIAGHKWSSEYQIDEEPTCTKAGTESIHCIECGDIKEGSQRDISASGHNWSPSYTLDTEATCSSEGRESIHCEICDAIKEESVRAIEKKEHYYSSWEMTQYPTCTDEGEEKRTCYNCGYEDTQVIPANGHEFYDWETSVSASIFKPGIETRICNICGAEETREIPIVKPFAAFDEKVYSVGVKKSLNMNELLVMGQGDTVNKWKVSKKSVASISKAGRLKAKKKGTVKVTATLKSGKAAVCTVKVVKPKAEKVYWVSGGSVYHKSRDCPTLSRSKKIKSGTIKKSKKKRCCKVCG